RGRRGASGGVAAGAGWGRAAPGAFADEPLPPAPPPDSAPLVADAFRQRPDLVALRFAADAAARFADAEGDLVRPSVAAAGAAGLTPLHQTGINDRYAALGVNVTVPIANGNLFSARHAEAALRARAQQQRRLGPGTP